MTDETADDDTDTEEQDPTIGENGFYAEGLTVYSEGKVTIPHRLREMYDIEYRDAVDVIVVPEDGEPLLAPELIVDSDGRVRIPYRRRRLHDIEDDDTVSLGVEPTGKRLPPDDE